MGSRLLMVAAIAVIAAGIVGVGTPGAAVPRGKYCGTYKSPDFVPGINGKGFSVLTRVAPFVRTEDVTTLCSFATSAHPQLFKYLRAHVNDATFPRTLREYSATWHRWFTTRQWAAEDPTDAPDGVSALIYKSTKKGPDGKWLWAAFLVVRPALEQPAPGPNS
jgi:hypothetical protein